MLHTEALGRKSKARSEPGAQQRPHPVWMVWRCGRRSRGEAWRGCGGAGLRPSSPPCPRLHGGVWRQNPGVPAGTAPLRSQRFAKNTVTPSFSPRGNF